MMRHNKIALLVASLFASTTLLSYAEEIQFDDIKVSGKASKEKSDQDFTQAGAVTVRGENKELQSLDSVVRALPGTYTNIDPAQGTINVNIRGMSGFGRVNTLIDGVPQTFFGTSANGDSRYHTNEGGGLGPSSQFGTMIDTNFLTEISANKGFSADAHGINALAGSVNFKTIDVDDIVTKDQKVGLLSKVSYGTNKLGYNAMLALAGKTSAFSESGSLGGLFAYSQKEMNSNYKRGDSQYAQSNSYAKNLDQEPRSWLAKVEIKPNDAHRLLLSSRYFKNHVGGRYLINQHYGIDYRYQPDSNWIDFGLIASQTKNKQNYDPDSTLWQLVDASTKNSSNYLDIHNKSYVNIANSELQLQYGTSYFTNKYQRQATGVNQDNINYTPFAPSGKQRIASLYLNTKWKKDIYTLESGVNYTYSNFKGFKPSCGKVGNYVLPCFPQGAYNIDMVHYSVDPSVMLSAEFSDWFMPFVSYSRSMRMPNIQEVFFNNEGGASINPFLKPERAKTFQIGFNTFKHNVLSENDKLGIKALYYQSRIKDFITARSFYIAKDGRYTNSADLNNLGSASFHAQIATNSLEPVKTSGIEIEADYDAGTYFGKLSYSYEKTSQPVGITSGVGNFGFGDIYELPKHYGTLNTGIRLLEQKLTLGSIFKYVDKAKRLSPRGKNPDTEEVDTQLLPHTPIIVDVYAIYQINKHFTLKASVQNLFNKSYIDPLNSQNSTASQYVESNSSSGDGYTFTNLARGRTYVIGGEIRF